jgi:hypothetical protein
MVKAFAPMETPPIARKVYSRGGGGGTSGLVSPVRSGAASSPERSGGTPLSVTPSAI